MAEETETLPQFEIDPESDAGPEDDMLPEPTEEEPEALMDEEPEGMPEAEPEDMSQAEPEGVPQTEPEDMSQAEPEDMSQAEPEAMLQSESEDTSQAETEDMAQSEPEDAPQPITEETAEPASEAAQAQPSAEPQSSGGPEIGAADPAMDGGPSVLDALDQVADAFARLYEALPQWLVFLLVAIVASLAGAVIALQIRGSGVRREKEPEASEATTPTVRPALPPPENPAFRKYQQFLEEKGVSAKEQDAQMRAFADRFKDMRQNLRDLMPGDKDLEIRVEEVRDALDRGDFASVGATLAEIGAKENEDGLEKRVAARKHLMAAAVSKSVAGDLKMAMMEPAEAAEFYRQAIEALPPFQEDQHAEYLNKYGTASYQSGEHETAIAAFERALQILEKRLGKNHPDVATALNNLALLHYSRGNYEAAEPLYQRSLLIDEQTLGIDHPGVATDLNNLALLYKKKGDLEGAEPLLKRAMEIKEKHFDPGHPSLVTGLKNYAALLRSLGREEEAEVFERRATVLPPKRTDEEAA